MQKIVQETQIFGPIMSYVYYAHCYSLLIEAHEHYQKKSFRNRYTILGANGPITLSIPLIKGKNQKTPIKKVKIAYHESWYTNHIHSIQSAYGNAPYYHYFSDEIYNLLRSQEEHLYSFNLRALKLIRKFLSLSFEISETKCFSKVHPDMLDCRNKKLNDNITSSSRPGYVQVFEDKFGFVTGLSILDLLFNLGPEAYLYLQNYKIDDPEILKNGNKR